MRRHEEVDRGVCGAAHRGIHYSASTGIRVGIGKATNADTKPRILADGNGDLLRKEAEEGRSRPRGKASTR